MGKHLVNNLLKVLNSLSGILYRQKVKAIGVDDSLVSIGVPAESVVVIHRGLLSGYQFDPIGLTRCAKQ